MAHSISTLQASSGEGSRPSPKATDLVHRDLSWFAERVARGQKEIFTEIVTLTPAIAGRLLEMNDGNRAISKTYVKQVANDIRNGWWKLNGEAIIVAKNGELNTGQHRCLAVIEADMPIETVMVFGMPRETRLTVDMGRGKTSGDILHMQEVKNAGYIAAAARAMLCFKPGSTTTDRLARNAFTKQDIRRFYDSHATILDAAVTKAWSMRMGRLISISALAAGYALIHGANSAECDTFFDGLKFGSDLTGGSPILWLRQRFMQDSEKRLKSGERLETIIRHWNAWREGRIMRQHLKMMGQFPEIKS